MNWQQLKAILWLRWRLSQNQFVRAGSLSAVISAIVVAVLGLLAAACGVGGIAGGVAASRLAKPEVLMLICDGGIVLFLFLWLLGIITELQRSESIDIGKLMHLPVTLRQVFLFNFAASHLTPIIILFVPLACGFCIGLVFGAGWRMLWLAAVTATFLLMVTSWTYCLRGWLSALMANRRRAGAIAVWLTIGLVLVSQLPNFLVHTAGFGHRSASKVVARTHKEGGIPPALVRAHIFVPPGWVGYSAMTLEQGSYAPALITSLLSAALALAGLLRAESLTRRYYGSVMSEGSQRSNERKATRNGTAGNQAPALLVARRIPFLKDDVAGLALGSLRCLLRAPETRLALMMPVIMIVVMGGPALMRLRRAANQESIPFIVAAGLVLMLFLVAPMMSNVFGLDRGGFRALVLSPMSRSRIILGKNLAFIPIVLPLSFLVIVGATVFLHAGVSVFLMSVMQTLAGFALFATVSNYLAILAPYRYSMNRLKAKKPTVRALISGMASMVITPVIGAILMVPTLLQFLWDRFGLPAWVPLGVVAALVLLGLAFWVYSALLRHQGRLLQHCELAILHEVTTEMD